MPICHKCNQQFPFRIKIDNISHNLKSRKYCLECSPFKQHNTKKLEKEPSEKRICPKCNQKLPLSKFYSRRKISGASVYCKTCTNKQTVERQNRFKQQCVDYKGGKCETCGYNRCIAALDFHHTDPNKKDFNISNKKLKTLDEFIKNELDKCKLLCAVCHREHHWYDKYPELHLMPPVGFEPTT